MLLEVSTEGAAIAVLHEDEHISSFRVKRIDITDYVDITAALEYRDLALDQLFELRRLAEFPFGNDLAYVRKKKYRRSLYLPSHRILHIRQPRIRCRVCV